MPELPEVEVTRLSFVDRIIGATIESVQMGKPLRWPLGCEAQNLVSRRVLGVRRRGKYLLIDLSKGLLLVHLGMSGRITFGWPQESLRLHEHFELKTNQGVLRLRDPRRFGAVVYADSQDDLVATKLLGKLGVEPLSEDFDAQEFHRGLKKRTAPIKQVLLAGDLVVGVGNIYCSESLFLAGIRPTTKANTISLPRARKLHQAIVTILSQALELGGSTLKDFANADGDEGYFQLQAWVYGKKLQPCRICATPIKQIRQGQRSTFYCPQCQKN
jgi:formamidopyrimidine-DNA glycosylase